MYFTEQVIIAFIISLISTWLLTYPVKWLARNIGAMDQPDHRKIHTVITPRLGGLAIFLGVSLGLLYLRPNDAHYGAICVGALIIVVTGILDDKFQLRPIVKLAGQLLAAGTVIYSGLIVERITIPFIGLIELNNFSIIATVLWIVGVTNAINLIDGLDGLASGVSTIALTSILIMAVMDAKIFVFYLCVVLIASNIGFLFHNFYPAKIYMGDTGSMFLGYSISVVALLGLFKNVTLISLIIPVIVLAVPIFDTLFAIIRRWMNGENIMMPDKKHLHYQLLSAGFSHQSTVLIIYGFSAVFGVLAIVFSRGSLGLTLIVAVIFLIMVQIIAEIVGVVDRGKKPLVGIIGKFLRRNKIFSKK